MAQLLSVIWRLIFMGLFLCGSAYCSGTETAFFSLTRRQVRDMQQSRHRLQRLVARLLERPGDLLGALLLGNLIVNILFFAASSVLMLQNPRTMGCNCGGSARHCHVLYLDSCGGDSAQIHCLFRSD